MTYSEKHAEFIKACFAAADAYDVYMLEPSPETDQAYTDAMNKKDNLFYDLYTLAGSGV